MRQIAILTLLLIVIVNGQKCSDGGCCDLKTGTMRPKGTLCQTNPCFLPNACTGDNPYCPTGGKMRENGTVCPEGVCFMGKCKQATKCMGDCCDKEGRALIEGAPCLGGSCLNGICRALPPCMGTCCNVDKKPLEDGTPCPEGNCLSGMCVNLDKKCTAGTCCDQYKKLVRPKGFPCTNNPCAAKTQCDGVSEICPNPTHFKIDGTPCPKGICLAGVCSDNPNPTVKVDENGKLVPIPPKKADEKKNPTGSAMEIHHHFVATPSCSEGPCCDVVEKKVLDEGRACANKTCHIGVCDGRASGCAYVYSAMGTPCEDGKCMDGVCIKNCIGQCCRGDGVTPRTDGSVCHDGYCFAGSCVKSCKDDCCENIHGVPQAKADGSACNKGDGYCVKGDCKPFTVPVFQPKRDLTPEVIPDDSDHKLFAQSFKESFIKNFFRAAAKVENDQVDEEERKLLQKQLEKAKADAKAKKEAEEKALLETAMKSVGLQTSSPSSQKKSVLKNLTTGTNLIFLVAGSVVAFIVLVIVVAALAKGKKTEQPKQKLDDSEFEDYTPPVQETKGKTTKSSEDKYTF